MSKLPTEGEVGTNLDDLHCIAATEHAEQSGPDFVPTAAEAQRIEKGRRLLIEALI